MTNYPYELYVDNEKNDFLNELQAWPDKYYVTNSKGKILFESKSSSRKQGVVDIDCTWVLEYIMK